jgi:hypothetical protein
MTIKMLNYYILSSFWAKLIIFLIFYYTVIKLHFFDFDLVAVSMKATNTFDTKTTSISENVSENFNEKLNKLESNSGFLDSKKIEKLNKKLFYFEKNLLNQEKIVLSLKEQLDTQQDLISTLKAENTIANQKIEMLEQHLNTIESALKISTLNEKTASSEGVSDKNCFTFGFSSSTIQENKKL